jgi:hypothetical protein
MCFAYGLPVGPGPVALHAPHLGAREARNGAHWFLLRMRTAPGSSMECKCIDFSEAAWNGAHTVLIPYTHRLGQYMCTCMCKESSDLRWVSLLFVTGCMTFLATSGLFHCLALLPSNLSQLRPCPFVDHPSNHTVAIKMLERDPAKHAWAVGLGGFDLDVLYTFPMVSIGECENMVQLAEQYAAAKGGWSAARHARYQTTDLAVNEETPKLLELVRPVVRKLKKQVAVLYNRRLEWHDLFIVKYDMSGQISLDMHEDASVISFQVALNGDNAYSGGGTFFEEGQCTAKLTIGDCITFNGDLRHAGVGITRGTRYVLVGFSKDESKNSNPTEEVPVSFGHGAYTVTSIPTLSKKDPFVAMQERTVQVEISWTATTAVDTASSSSADTASSSSADTASSSSADTASSSSADTASSSSADTASSSSADPCEEKSTGGAGGVGGPRFSLGTRSKGDIGYVWVVRLDEVPTAAATELACSAARTCSEVDAEKRGETMAGGVQQHTCNRVVEFSVPREFIDKHSGGLLFAFPPGHKFASYRLV